MPSDKPAAAHSQPQSLSFVPKEDRLLAYDQTTTQADTVELFLQLFQTSAHWKRVHASDNKSIKTQITNKPTDAPWILCACFRRIDTRP